MANVHIMARSNHFLVRDREAFMAWSNQFEGLEAVEEPTAGSSRFVG